MGLRESMRSFADLHERAQRGELSDQEFAAYREELADLAHALLAVQQAALEPGQKPRHALRVARAVQVELTWGEWQVRTSTLNLSTGGFAALLTQPPPVGQMVNAALSLPGESTLHVRAKAVSSRPQAGYARVGFQFVALSIPECQRLGALVLDSVVSHLRR